MFDLLQFGERLSELMFEANEMTSEELAKAINVTPQTVNRWRRGEKAMKLSNLIKVSNNLNCTIDYLVARNNSSLDFIPKECSSFYKRLREIMEEKNISWYKLTHETSIKDSYLYFWKKGADTKITSLVELANYFECSIDYLVGRDR